MKKLTLKTQKNLLEKTWCTNTSRLTKSNLRCLCYSFVSNRKSGLVVPISFSFTPISPSTPLNADSVKNSPSIYTLFLSLNRQVHYQRFSSAKKAIIHSKRNNALFKLSLLGYYSVLIANHYVGDAYVFHKFYARNTSRTAKVSIFGSTGCVGRQIVDVIKKFYLKDLSIQTLSCNSSLFVRSGLLG